MVKVPPASVWAGALPGAPCQVTTTSALGGRPLPVAVVTKPAGPSGGFSVSTGCGVGCIDGLDGAVVAAGTAVDVAGRVVVAVVALVVGVVLAVVDVRAVVGAVVVGGWQTGAEKLTSNTFEL